MYADEPVKVCVREKERMIKKRDSRLRLIECVDMCARAREREEEQSERVCVCAQVNDNDNDQLYECVYTCARACT